MSRPVPLGLVIGQLVQGGAERQLVTLLRALDRERFSPTVFCLSDLIEPMGPLVTATGTPLVVLRRRAHFDPSRVIRLAKECRRREIQLLHAYLLEANVYAALARLLLRKTALISSNRNAMRSQNPVRHRFHRWGLASGDRILVNSEDLLRFTQTEYELPQTRFQLVYNAVDTDRFDATDRDEAIRKQLGATNANLLVGAIGRIVPQKNPRLFLELASQVAARVPGVRFSWVGTGPLQSWMARQIRERGLRYVVTLANQRQDIPRVLKAFDLVVQTSDFEGLPNVVLEAMAAGRPVVATDVGGTREALGDLGRLCPAGALDLLADAVVEMLRDPEARRRAGEAGRRRVGETFSVRAMVENTENLYDAVLTGT
jgi:glycosyltransferase involved in cell wall biosynthesis